MTFPCLLYTLVSVPYISENLIQQFNNFVSLPDTVLSCVLLFIYTIYQLSSEIQSEDETGSHEWKLPLEDDMEKQGQQSNGVNT